MILKNKKKVSMVASAEKDAALRDVVLQNADVVLQNADVVLKDVDRLNADAEALLRNAEAAVLTREVLRHAERIPDALA